MLHGITHLGVHESWFLCIMCWWDVGFLWVFSLASM